MNKTDWREFTDLLKEECEMFNYHPHNFDALRNKYWLQLKQFSLETIRAAFFEAEKRGEFFPKLVTLLSVIREQASVMNIARAIRPPAVGPRAREVVAKFLKELSALLPYADGGAGLVTPQGRRGALDEFERLRLPQLRAEWREMDRLDRGGDPQQSMTYEDGTEAPEEAPF